jgi:hypothetical protein
MQHVLQKRPRTEYLLQLIFIPFIIYWRGVVKLFYMSSTKVVGIFCPLQVIYLHPSYALDKN